MEFPFEFCALRFLLQWQGKEKALHRQIRATPTIDELRKALRYFQVARNFKGLKEQQKAEAALASLLRVRARQSLLPVERVKALADEFQGEFQQLNLSAASKLLWLSSRKPFIIYDSRAVTALRDFYKYKFDRKNYAEYCVAWRAEYTKHKGEIKAAVSRLPEVRAFMPAWPLTDDEMLRLVKASWFKERVFDIYLWEVGGDG